MKNEYKYHEYVSALKWWFMTTTYRARQLYKIYKSDRMIYLNGITRIYQSTVLKKGN